MSSLPVRILYDVITRITLMIETLGAPLNNCNKMEPLREHGRGFTYSDPVDSTTATAIFFCSGKAVYPNITIGTPTRITSVATLVIPLTSKNLSLFWHRLVIAVSKVQKDWTGIQMNMFQSREHSPQAITKPINTFTTVRNTLFGLIGG